MHPNMRKSTRRRKERRLRIARSRWSLHHTRPPTRRADDTDAVGGSHNEAKRHAAVTAPYPVCQCCASDRPALQTPSATALPLVGESRSRVASPFSDTSCEQMTYADTSNNARVDQVARGRSARVPPRRRRPSTPVVCSNGKTDVDAFECAPKPVRRPVDKAVVVLLHPSADSEHVAVAADEVVVTRVHAEVVCLSGLHGDSTHKSKTHPGAGRAFRDLVRAGLAEKASGRTARVAVDHIAHALTGRRSGAPAVKVRGDGHQLAARRRREARDAFPR